MTTRRRLAASFAVLAMLVTMLTPSPPVEASGAAPTADAGGPYAIAEGDLLSLSASGSTDPELDPLSHTWDLDNDGEFDDAAGESPVIAWSQLAAVGVNDDGVWTIAVRVDDGTSTDVDTTSLTVSNAAPTVSGTGASVAAAGTPYELTVNVDDPGDDTISAWVINWGDGAISSGTGEPGLQSHTYDVAGLTQPVTIQVTDEDGTWNTADVVVDMFDTVEKIGRFDAQTGSKVTDLATSGGSLANPYGATLGPDGLLYVAGATSDNVVRYDPADNSYVDTFVAAGAGGLDTAKGLAFGPDGNLYVASSGTAQVLRFDGSTGGFIDVFVTAANLTDPISILFRPEGDLVVSDGLDDEILRYDATTGAYLGVFATTSPGDRPAGLTIGPDGNVYAAMFGSDTVREYDAATGTLVGTFVTATGAGPHSLRFGPDGHLWVSIYGTEQVSRFDGSTGAALGVIITEPSPAGPFGLTFVPDLAIDVRTPLEVNSTGDSGDLALGDGVCDTGATNASGADECTLRAAIEEANAALDADAITFDIPVGDGGHSGGVWTIATASPLPAIAYSTVLDASTQAGYSTPVVVIDGSGQGSGDGLLVHGDDVTIRGFALHSNPDEGIDVHSTADRVTIADNHIGTNAAGTVAIGNGDVGLELGGLEAVVSGNLISGSTREGILLRENAHRSRVVGNRIGTDVTGNVALGNGEEGIEVMNGQDDVVLGEPGNGNVISGNSYAGINGWGNTPSRTIVQANLIGVGADGTTSVPNGTASAEGGVTVRTMGQEWLIGGTGSGEGNIIANNNGDGVQLVNVNGAADDIAILGNSIYANTDLGIDIDNDGVTANDAFDADAGINDRLNHPVITTASLSGGTVTVGFDLDVPAGNYRIEAFTNPAGDDPTGHGEGQVFRDGGTISHTGSGSESFEVTYAGSAGDAFALTATEDLGSGSYGSTSEFSTTFTAPCAPSDSDADGLYDCWETQYGDTDGDGTPNQLDTDDDGDGTPTASENADPNADGDPRDAIDSDHDGQPNWLDIAAGVSTTPVTDEQKISATTGGLTGPVVDDDRFGEDVAAIGDLDGDGVNDLVVGAPNDDGGGTNRGAVHVLFLNADGTVRAEQRISSISGSLTGTLDDNDSFGRAVAAIGDLDGDGIGDIAVGTPGDDDGGADRGAVYVLFLNTDGTVKSEQKISDTQGNLVATLGDADVFGRSVAGIGDVDGDGTNDIAVGADSDDDGGSDRGAVYVLFLNTDGTVKSEQKISDTQGNLTATLDDWDYFGRSVTEIGDVDGDGTPDLAVGAGSDDDGGANRGAVYVLFLNTNGTVKSEQKISDTQGNLTATLDDADTFGASLAGIGDVDGNGTPDLAVGALRDDDGGTDRGAIYVLTLTTAGTVDTEQKISDSVGGLSAGLDDSDGFGNSITGIGDLDGDGAIDLAVGTPGDDDGGTDRGAAYILKLSAVCGADSDSDGLLDCWEARYGDTDGDSTPNQFDTDDDGDGTPTVSENADPNGDGDPRDATDSDRDGQPDWLDAPITTGSTGTVADEVEVASTTGGFSVTLGDSDSFGTAVTSIGDLDGDGIPELVAAAPDDDDTNAGSGAAYVLFMNADGTVRTEQKISNLEGGLTMAWSSFDGFGDSVAGIGDIDGDGIPDLAIGAHEDDDGGTSRGGVVVVFMNADGTVKAEQKISELEGGGPILDDSDWFGDVTNLGDLDGDGVNDIAVGAHGDDDGANGAGAVWIVFLDTDGTAKSTQKISATSGGFGGALDGGDNFGRDVAGLGDVDGDGIPDLAVGARYDDDGGSNRGAVWVLFLDMDGTVKNEQKISSITGGLASDIDNSDYLGGSLAGVGDLDLDGTPDLVVGATADDDGASSSNRGAAHVLFLEPDGTVGRNTKISDAVGGLTAPLANTDYFGSSVTGVGDLDGDGVTDLAVGARYRDTGGTNRGAVFVLLTATDLPSTTVTVNSTGDDSDDSPGDGTCQTATPGECTLRAAIEEANASTAVDVVEFAIPQTDLGYTAGPDAFTFTPASVYPNITERVSIDGTTQAEYVDQPVIVIDGSGTGTADVVGIHLDAGSDGSVVRALNINSYDDFGMRISSSGHHTITGMVLGLERDGATAAGNRYGIDADTAMYVTIGGTGANEGNVIAAGDWGLSWYNDSIHGTFVGNKIGTDVTGLLDRGHRFDGLLIVNSSSYAQVGGPTAAHANVVAGNGDDGISVGTGTTVDPVIEGNLVGVGADGTTPIPNDGDGIELGWGTGAAVIDNVVGPAGEAGIEIQNHTGAIVQGNTIGTDRTRTETFTLGGAGLELGSNVHETDIGGLGTGEPNVITNATGAGIAVLGTAGTDNQFIGNVIVANGGLGVDLNDDGVTPNDTDDTDTGPNDLVNFPVIVLADESSPGVLTVDYLLDGPAGTYDVHFYTNPSGADASGFGEGEVFVGSDVVVKGSPGLSGHSTTFAGSAGDLLAATASLQTPTLSRTSEFSETVAATTTAIVVNSTGNNGDASPGDEVCDTGATNSTGHPECTLLAAIQEANAAATIDTIDFHIPVTDGGHASGVWTITPTGALPNITSTVSLDARTQPGWSGTPVIEIDGSATTTAVGLHAQLGTGTTIAGFSIGDYTRPIAIQDPGAVVQGNWVGVRADGVSTWTVAPETGIRIINSAHDAVVGGTGTGEPNVVVGATAAGIYLFSSDRAVIQGNIIGRLPDGTTAQPNAVGIRLDGFSDSTAIGGTAGGQANLIADNTGDAVEVLSGSANHLLGNTIVGNGGLAVDLIGGTEDGFGVTANDAGDIDTGANDLLNRPEPTSALAAGSAVTVDFDLDVPAGDYRIEVFTNPAGADVSGSGEAELFVAAAAITHTGSGSESFQIVYTGSSGDIVTLSATEDLGAATFGSTSELSPAFTVAVDVTATVNSTGDLGDAAPGDGVCDTGGLNSEGDPECTLRAVIEEANAGSIDTVEFAIPTSDAGHSTGVWTIAPTTELPDITAAASLDASTQPGAVANTTPAPGGLNGTMAIVLDGSGVPAGGDGFDLWATVTLRGFVVNSFPDQAVIVRSGGTGSIVAGNYIGTNATGTSSAGNGDAGIRLEGGSTTIGGTIPADRNLISGNVDGIYAQNAAADANLIQGNLIGTDATGLLPLPNTDRGIQVESGADNNVIGGSATASNVISGNGTDGILVSDGVSPGTGADTNVIRSNLIGVGADATSPLGNGANGIRLTAVAGTVIGGIAPGDGNTIANNGADGVSSGDALGDDTSVLGNTIFANTGLGIDLGPDGVTANDASDVDSGANDLMNFPVVTAATPNVGNVDVDFDLDVPAGTYRVEFFSNPRGGDASGNGEGEVFLGATTVVHGGTGTESFTHTVVGPGLDLTSTATQEFGGGLFGSSSEFSTVFTVPGQDIATVNSSGDASDATPGDGACDTGDTNSEGDPECTLRAAIEEVNATVVGTIEFAIPTSDGGHSAGVWTIAPSSGPFADLTGSTTIDGSTQPGWAGDPIIGIDGTAYTATPDDTDDGFELLGDDSTITGLAIYGFADELIKVGGDRVTVRSSWLGISPTGSVVLPAATTTTPHAFQVNGDDFTFGGPTDADGNVVATAADDAVITSTSIGAVIENNHFGVAGDGITALTNPGPDYALRLRSTSSSTVRDNQFGNLPAGAIRVDGSATATVVGNTFGTDPSLTAFMPVSTAIHVREAATVRFGGTGVGDANIVRNASGIAVEHHPGSTGTLTMLRSSIADSAGLAIDLNGDGVTANDAGDVDTGPNNLLNFPDTRHAIEATGTVTVDIELDVPAGDYRIELFTNPSGADPSDHGEAEVFEAATTVTHTGSGVETFSITYAGSVDDVIALTATEDLGGGAYGSTSELGAVFTVTDAALVTVNSSGDGADVSPGDGRCDTGFDNSEGDAECTLRAAIEETNASAAVTTIEFAVPTSDVANVGGDVTIAPTSALPVLTSAVTIDATTQTGWSAVAGPVVHLDGTSAGPATHGIELQAAAATIRGLAIGGFTDTGVRTQSSAIGVTLEQNWIGLDLEGNADPNANGLWLTAGGAGAVIGGAGVGNVISGNAAVGITVADDATIHGNIIGLDPTGTTAIPNGSHGIQVIGGSGAVTIGGLADLANTVSGNGDIGVRLAAEAAVVGNRIGVALDGSTLIGNGSDNLRVVAGGDGSVIGSPGLGNTIRGATDRGINVLAGVAGVTIEANTVTDNGSAGIATHGATILGNTTANNGGLGIDDGDDGPTPNDAGDLDGITNTPVIGSVQRVAGDLVIDVDLDTVAGDHRIEVFGNTAMDPSGFGEGETLLGTAVVTHTGAGAETFQISVTSAATILSATSTRDLGAGAYGGTSEHSAAVPSPDLVIVNSTGDGADVAVGDGECATGATNALGAPECTYRAAIQEANDPTTPVDTIWFAIPASDPGHAGGIWTIDIATALPPVTAPVSVDGSTQPGFVANTTAAPLPMDHLPVIELDGADLGDGIQFAAGADGSTIHGLAIGGFGGAGGHGIEVLANDVTITGSVVGLRADGSSDNPNGSGISVNADRTNIGGTTPASRNVVAGSQSTQIIVEAGVDIQILGNIIGADATTAAVPGVAGTGVAATNGTSITIGTLAAPNVIAGGPTGSAIEGGADDVSVVGNRIGTDAAFTADLGGARGISAAGTMTITDNVIGNADEGIELGSDGVTLERNTVGTDPTGTIDLGNTSVGIRVEGDAGSAIGGATAADANLITFNDGPGIIVGANTLDPTILVNRIWGNAGIGIDHDDDGPTANDAGDVDDVPNGVALGLPIPRAGINELPFTLDAPAGTYRIDLYENPSGTDPSGFGEGEQHVTTFNLGHTGGTADYVRAIALTAAPLSATVTHPDGRTSEFSNGVAALDPDAIVIDLSIRRSDLLIANGASPDQAGLIGAAIATNGGLLTGPALDITSAALSLSAVVRADSLTGDDVVISKRTAGGTPIYELGVDGGTGEATATLRIGGASASLRGGSIAAGTWHDLTVDWNGTAVVLFVDGVEVDRATATGALATAPTTEMTIGGRDDRTRLFDGRIDHVRVGTGSIEPGAITATNRIATDPTSLISVGAEQRQAPGSWTTTTDRTRSGDQAASAPTTSGADAAAWLVADGIDEPGVVFESFWWLEGAATIELSAGTRTGLAPTDQYEIARTAAGGWELRRRNGAGETIDASAGGAFSTGAWVRVEVWTDQDGHTRVVVDGVEIFSWTEQGNDTASGSIGLRVANLPDGTNWYVDDARARRLVTPEPIAELGTVDRP